MITGAADGDIVTATLSVELGGGQIACGADGDGAGLAVAVRAHAVGGAAVRVNLAEVGPNNDTERTRAAGGKRGATITRAAPAARATGAAARNLPIIIGLPGHGPVEIALRAVGQSVAVRSTGPMLRPHAIHAR